MTLTRELFLPGASPIRLASTALLLALASCSAGEPPVETPPPVEPTNAPSPAPATAGPPEFQRIVLITIDTLRADHLALFGYPRDTAPFLTSLAEKGILLENSFSCSTHTGPSHASMLTSLYPYQHGLLRNGEHLRGSPPTLAALLERGGYRTGAFASVSFLKGVRAGFEEFDVSHPRRISRPGHLTIDSALNWVGTLPPDAPYFLWIHLYDVHEWKDDPPLYAPFVEQVRQSTTVDEPAFLRLLEERRLDSPSFEEVGLQRGPRIDAYDGRIRFVDHHLERLFDALETGPGRSLWIITSDHGEGLGAHQYLMHGMMLYQELLQVPTVVYLSDEAYTDVRVEALTRSVDLMPTVLDLAGLEPPAQLEGRSMLPLFEDPTGPFAATSLAERRPADSNHPASPPMAVEGDALAVHSLSHKYIFKSEEPDEAYDLAADPLELNDLAAEEDPELDPLKEEADLHYQRIVERRSERDTPAIDEEELENLEALGYLN